MTNNNKKKEVFSLWLIGPSASGKTTVSKNIYKKLSDKCVSLTLLDGDHARKIFVNESGYDPISRSKNIHKYVSVVSWLNSFGVSTIVAAINAFEKDRVFCRKEIKNYKEVFLKCSLDERIKRDTKKLYLPAISGKKKNVVDVDIPFEIPANGELTIETDKDNPENIADTIIKKLNL
jgi:adenylylsulfate kinase-like enzyme